MKNEQVKKDITKTKGRGGKIERLHGTTEAVTSSKGSKQIDPDWAATFDAITDLVSIHDKDFKLVKINKSFADLLKVKPEDVIGKKCYEIFHGTKEPPADCPYKKVIDTKKSHRVEFFELHLGLYLDMSVSPIFDENGDLTGSVHIIKDITEHKLAEKEILEKQEQLRALTAQLSMVEERERRTIAKGLHDEIIQPLIFLDVKLASLLKRDTGRVLSTPFKEMQTIIAGLLQQTRSLTFDLSSPLLYELGLKAAVKDWLTNQVQKRHGIKTIFKTEGQSKSLEQDVRIFLYKAVRELLNNVVKHANAASVEVSICYDDDKTIISVRDDGKGFDVDDKKKLRFDRDHGFGFFSIKEKLKSYGGAMTIDSTIGEGTEIILTMPMT